MNRQLVVEVDRVGSERLRVPLEDALQVSGKGDFKADGRSLADITRSALEFYLHFGPADRLLRRVLSEPYEELGGDPENPPEPCENCDRGRVLAIAFEHRDRYEELDRLYDVGQKVAAYNPASPPIGDDMKPDEELIAEIEQTKHLMAEIAGLVANDPNDVALSQVIQALGRRLGTLAVRVAMSDTCGPGEDKSFDPWPGGMIPAAHQGAKT